MRQADHIRDHTVIPSWLFVGNGCHIRGPIHSLYALRNGLNESLSIDSVPEVGRLAAIGVLATAWAGGYLLELLAPTLERKIFWAVAQYPFILSIPIAMLAFILISSLI